VGLGGKIKVTNRAGGKGGGVIFDYSRHSPFKSKSNDQQDSPCKNSPFLAKGREKDNRLPFLLALNIKNERIS
jgi:hypothetical protein